MSSLVIHCGQCGDSTEYRVSVITNSDSVQMSTLEINTAVDNCFDDDTELEGRKMWGPSVSKSI